MASDEPTFEERVKEAKMVAQFTALLTQKTTADAFWTQAVAGLFDELTDCWATMSEEERLTAEPLLAIIKADLRSDLQDHPQVLALLDSLRELYPILDR